MNENLYRIVYLSRNLISGDSNAVRQEISQILRTARKNNLEQNISGALMFNAGCFAQVLEGPRDRVEQLFDRIQLDDRHSDVVILDRKAVETRGFPEWSMAYIGTESDMEMRFFMIAEETNFKSETLSGDQVYAALLENLEKSESPPTADKAA